MPFLSILQPILTAWQTETAMWKGYLNTGISSAALVEGSWDAVYSGKSTPLVYFEDEDVVKKINFYGEGQSGWIQVTLPAKILVLKGFGVLSLASTYYLLFR